MDIAGELNSNKRNTEVTLDFSHVKWYDLYHIEENSWKTFDSGETYYFAEKEGRNGSREPCIVRGWEKIHGKWYYFSKTGALKKGISFTAGNIRNLWERIMGD